MKTIIANDKSEIKITKQLKNWFKMNPNRKVVELKYDHMTKTINRKDIIK